MGGYERNPHAVGARRHPGRLRGAAAARGLGALRGAHRERRSSACRRWRRARSSTSSTGPRPSRPTASSSSASPTCRASGSPPASARTGSPAPGGIGKVDGRVDRRRPARVGRLAHGHPPLRPPLPQPALHARPHRTRRLSKYYDIKYPGEERKAGRPLRVSPAYPRHRELGAVVRREGGLGARQLVRVATPPAATRRCARAAGRARTGRRRSAPRRSRRAQRGGPLRPVQLLEARGARPRRAARSCERLCANRIDRPVGSVVYTQLLNPRGGIEADLSVIAPRAPTASSSSPARRSATHDRALDRAAPAAATASVYVADVTSARACFCLWGPRARDDPAAAHEDVARERDFPYMHGARDRASATCRAWRSRVTYVASSAGSSTARPSTALAPLGRALGGGRGARPDAAGYRAIDALRLEKGYRAWATDLTPETHAGRGGARLRGEARQGRVHRPRRARRARAAGGPPERLVCLVLDDPRAIALGSEPVRLAAARSSAASRAAATATRWASIALAYVPSALRRAGHAGRGRHLRRLGRRRGPRRAALRPSRRAGSRVTERRSTR